MKKFFLSVLVIVSMFLFCDDVFASYTNKIYVGSTEVTSDNENDVFGDGKVSYDSTNHILTLDNYVLESTSDDNTAYTDGSNFSSIVFDIPDEVTIKFKGNNKINFDILSGSPYYYGIRSSSKINLIGEGDNATLESNITGYGNTVSVYGLNEISFSNLNVKSYMNEVAVGYAIYSYDKITINNSSFDIEIDNTIVSCGINSDNGASIDKSKFNIRTDNSVLVFDGIYVVSDVSIKDSNFKITSTGENDEIEQHGFYIDGGTSTIDNTVMDVNLRGKTSYGYYLDNAEINNSKIFATFDMTTKTDTNYGLYVSDSLKIKDSICKIDGTEGSLIGVTLELDGGVFILSNIIDTVNVTYKNIDLNEVYLSNESFEKINVAASLDDIQGSHYILISADESTYEYLEGKDSKFDINKTNTLKLRVDGIYCLFKDMSIDGVKYVVGEDINVSEGSTIIEFTATGLEKIKKLSIGEHTIEVNYLNTKKTTTKLNIVEEKEEVKEEENVVENKTEEVIENPKTGDNILINISLLIISLISIIYVALKKKSIKSFN